MVKSSKTVLLKKIKIKHNDFETLNTSRINTTFKTSKFRTDLTYLKESEFFGSSSYVETDLIYNFNSDNNLTFGTRRNRKLNLTEYYNLIYDYKNDCLIASIDYKKSYYGKNKHPSGESSETLSSWFSKKNGTFLF